VRRRVRYTGLKGAARGEAFMQIEWFWGLSERHREELLELESVKAGLVWL
jgi:hypothetical protein